MAEKPPEKIVRDFGVHYLDKPSSEKYFDVHLELTPKTSRKELEKHLDKYVRHKRKLDFEGLAKVINHPELVNR